MQAYELKLSEVNIKVKKFQDLNKNQEETIRRMKGQISEEKRLTMDQAKRIDDLLSTIKKNEQMHHAHMQRLQGQLKQDKAEMISIHKSKIRDMEIEWESDKRLIEELKKLHRVEGGSSEAETLRLEITRLKHSLSKALKSEKKFDEILIVKDLQIQDLLDYKK